MVQIISHSIVSQNGCGLCGVTFKWIHTHECHLVHPYPKSSSYTTVYNNWSLLLLSAFGSRKKRLNPDYTATLKAPPTW